MRQTDGKVETWRIVDTLAEAEAVFFLCPYCFKKNNGPVGTHSIRIPFSGRKRQHEPMWDASGNSLDDLTTNPSILNKGGDYRDPCQAHFYIRNGAIINC